MTELKTTLLRTGTTWALTLVAIGTFQTPSVAKETTVPGRYVRLEIPALPAIGEDKRDFYRLIEIEVFSNGVNVAPKAGILASQSGGPGGGNLNRLIDGNNLDFINSACSLPPQINPWIELDLGTEMPIDAVRIYGRGSLMPSTKVWLLSTLDAGRRLTWYRRFEFSRVPTGDTLEPKPFTGRYTGLKLAPKCGSWYRLDGEQEAERRLKVVNVDFGPVPNFSARQAAFLERDSEAGVTELCRRFAAALDSEAKGLEKFRSLVAKGRYQAALDAYREFFFGRLANPEKIGIPVDFELFQGADLSDMTVNADAVAAAMAGRRIVYQGGEQLIGTVGEPGATRWTPTLAAGREVSKQEEEFFYMPQHNAAFFVMFSDLLKSYIARGDKKHLSRWMDYVDDWCLYGREEFLNCPLPLTQATEVSHMGLISEHWRWRRFLATRPEFARELRSTTLVRWLLAATEDAAPFSIRARRTELANHGAIGLRGMGSLGILFPEFQAMREYSREAVRLSMSTFIQHRTLDGENIEASDEGHRFSDIGARETIGVASLMPLDPRLGVLDPLSRQLAADQFFPAYRNYLTRLTPDGYDLPCWAGTSTLRPAMDVESRRYRINHTAANILGERRKLAPGQGIPDLVDLVEKEPEAAARIAAVMGYPASLWTKLIREGALPEANNETKAQIAAAQERVKADPAALGRRPERLSDAAPYAGMYFLRDRWQPGAETFMLFVSPERSQDHDLFVVPKEGTFLGYGAMRYDLMKDGRLLVSSECVIIDKKAPNMMHEAIPTGGKTDYCAMAGRHVSDTRFHTSTLFDLAEARRANPYSRPEVVRGDWYNIWRRHPEIDNTPLFGITAWRQVFHVRGEGIWIVADRIENPTTGEHEFSTFWTYPVWIRPQTMAKAVPELATANYPLVEESQGRVRTAIPEAANLSSYIFGPAFEMINWLNPDGTYAKGQQSALSVLAAAVKKNPAEAAKMQLNGDPTKVPFLRRAGVLWKGTGNQTLVTLHATREAEVAGAEPFANDLRQVEELKGTGGVAGFRARTRAGTELFFQSGPQRRNALVTGPVAAEAEALLVVKKAGELSGIALGCTKLSINGRACAIPGADFEYTLSAENRFAAMPIHGMIDTVKILPEASVFTDTVDVSFTIPTQNINGIEFRYTLDGSDPSLNASLYQGPITLTEDTYVKVRPFRKGLTAATPWNIPDERAGKTVGAIFRKQAPRPAVTEPIETGSGLCCDYLEGAWPALFAHAAYPGVLPVKAQQIATGLLEPDEVKTFRATDKAYALRYSGFLKVPATGVYTFFAPEHLLTPTMDAGFDLRVVVDGEEWFPAPTLHGENNWSLALAEGLHRLEVTFVDFRWKQFKNDYMLIGRQGAGPDWFAWKEGQMWQGIPKLEIAGPEGKRQPVPAEWLRREGN
jgi:hypothetical protein